LRTTAVLAINGDEMIIIGNYLIAPLKKCERWVPGVEGCGASTRGGLSDPRYDKFYHVHDEDD